MNCARRLQEDLYWLGGNDRRLAQFENAFPIPRGISYNAYLITDEKIALLDTVDRAVTDTFFENLSFSLNGRPLDYVITQHMEPDHAATLRELLLRHPEATVLCTTAAAKMIRQFFGEDSSFRVKTVADGDVLTLGRHSLRFLAAPMVHWPEVMVTYDQTDGVLFSADAFGTFGALSGNLFADELAFERDWLSESRRYYANIVGKYGAQVQALLQKAEGLTIRMLCPLHGPIWRRDIAWYWDKYRRWSAYQPEENAVLIVYGSIYGHTQNAAEALAGRLAELGVRNIALYDASVTPISTLVGEAFRCSHLVVASPTYNAAVFTPVAHFLQELKAHNLQNRTVGIIENGSWAPTAGNQIRRMLEELKNMHVLNAGITLRSALHENQRMEMETMAAELFASLQTAAPSPDTLVDSTSLFKLSYGLFVLSAKEGDKDNACIINTVTQITSSPIRISIAVNKANYTHDMILKTGLFNVSVLDQTASFPLFQRFGFQSGRDTDKFAGLSDVARSQNGLLYVTQSCNALLSGKVISATDYGTHTLFVADVTEARVLSAEPSVTYAYYFANIKPKPASKPKEEKKRGFVCKICGYFYEGETLPEDFICPICKHGAADFEPVGFE